jgi:hypothetical protein
MAALTCRFHPGGGVDGVAEQAVTRHREAHDPCTARACTQHLEVMHTNRRTQLRIPLF